MLMCPQCREFFDDQVTVCPNDGAVLDTPSDSRLGMTLAHGVTLNAVAGTGAMGTVYQGWQATMERRVAVKMLHGDLAREQQFVERFLREAKAVARLNHPNIVTIHSVGEHQGRPYLVMEFIDGQTIADAIESKTLTAERTIRIARQVTSALADAHAAGIIHRDLKPSNVLLSQRRRSADFVKILDFGVAKVIGADSQLTRDGFVFGTPAYLSPEQANDTEIDGRADLYSLGVMMYEMLTGTLPFTGNQIQLLMAHAKENAPPILSRDPLLNPKLAKLIDGLLAKDPNERPASAEQVADALDELDVNGTTQTPWASMALQRPDLSVAAQSAAESTRPRGWRSAADTTPPRELTTPGAATLRWRPTRTHSILLGLAGLVLLVAGAGAVAFGPLAKHLPETTVLVTPGGAAEVAFPPPDSSHPNSSQPKIKTDIAREALMFSAGGYSLRVLRPKRILIGIYYESTIDVWDPDGEPIDANEIIVLFEEPQGERPFSATATESRGKFAIRRRYDDPGRYSMRIYAPSLDSPIVVHFDVLAP